MHTHCQPLTMLRPGEKGIIAALKLDHAARHRLIGRGLMIGSPIEIVCSRAEGNLLMLAIADTRLAIEHETAQHIWVTPTESHHPCRRVSHWLKRFGWQASPQEQQEKRHRCRHRWWNTRDGHCV